MSYHIMAGIGLVLMLICYVLDVYEVTRNDNKATC